jgi:hypothetical protein
MRRVYRELGSLVDLPALGARMLLLHDLCDFLMR